MPVPSHRRATLALMLAAMIAASNATGTLAKKKRPWPLDAGKYTTIHYRVETADPCYTKPAHCGACTGLTSSERGTLRRALDEIERHTPLRFVEGPAGNERHILYKHDYCGSKGYTSVTPDGNTLITLAAVDAHVVIHETGHAVGLAHEQRRPDRDYYVRFHKECLQDPYDPSQTEPYEVMSWSTSEVMGPFDYDSVMIYPSFGRSRDPNCNIAGGLKICCPTLLKKSNVVTFRYNGVNLPGDEISGDNPHLSPEDINTIYQMYPPRLGNNEPGDHFAHALAAGDFDGDGYQDLAVGAQDEVFNGIKSGLVFLYKGTISGLVPWKMLSGEELAAPRSGDRFGEALLGADLDGDGMDELVVGAPGKPVATGSYGQASAGAVFVFLGSDSGPTAQHGYALNAEKAGFAETNHSGDLFGKALAAGDFDGHGKRGLAVGAPGKYANAGRVFVFRWDAARPAGARLVKFDEIGTQRTPGDLFGSSLAAGPLGGSSATDLVVGSPESSYSHGAGGAVYVFRGGASGFSAVTEIRQPAGGPKRGDEFGAAVAVGHFAAGRQVVAGAPGRSGHGMIYVLQLKDTGPAFTVDKWRDYNGSALIGPSPGDSFGRVVAVSDFDGDGLDDLAAGVPNKKINGVPSDGLVLLFHGAGSPDFLEKWHLYRQPMSYPPDVPGDRFGASLAAGDFNRSTGAAGVDLAIGASGKYFESGAFYVARGRKGEPPELGDDKNPASIATPPSSGEWHPGFWTFFDQESQDPR